MRGPARFGWLRLAWVAPVGVALVAAAVRLPGTFTQALSQDEVASARILREPTFASMLARVARTESTPPLWYALGWLASHAGVPLLDVRLLSVLAGSGAAAAVVVAGRDLLPRWCAVVAGLLVALGGEFVAHGHELRSYELLAFVSALFLWLLLHELRAPSRRAELALGAAVALGGLTHYFFAFEVLAALAWLWLDRGAQAVRRRATIAIVCGSAAAAPWAPVMLAQYHRNRFWWIGPFRPRAVAAVPLRLFTFAYGDRPLGFALSIASLVLAAWGCSRLQRSGAAGRLVATLAFGPLATAACLWVAGVQIFALRNLIEIGPAVALVAGGALAALAAIRVRPAMLAGAAGVACLALPLLAPAGTGPPFGAIARALVREGWRPADPLAVFGNFFVFRAPLEWYLPRSPLLDASHRTDGVCRTVFVISRRLPRGLARDATGHVPAGGFVVSRLDLSTPLASARALRRASILADPRGAGPCVDPIEHGRLAPIT